MTLAMLACLAALCLTGPDAHAASGEADRPAPPAAITVAAKAATPAVSDQPAPAQPVPVQAAPVQATPNQATPAQATPAPAAPGQGAQAPGTQSQGVQGQGVQGQTAPRPISASRAERRRRSYAACNRASHQRSLRGGKRRRFLIRCRLGYERTRIPQAVQPGAPPQPAPNPPARRP